MTDQVQRSWAEARLWPWVQANARKLFIAVVVLAVPYLLLCNGMAIFIVSALFSSGSCGQ
jgi:hypothetical protein